MATPTDIAKIVNILEAAYPNWLSRKDAQQIDLVNEVYYQDLKMFDTDLLMSAVTRCRRSRDYKDFAPSVGAIRSEVMRILREIEGIPTDLQAWDEVSRADKPRDNPLWRGGKIVEETPYQWSHPIVGQVARMLGFPNFPKIKNGGFDNEMADRAHFVKFFEFEVEKYLEQKTEHPQVEYYIDSQKQNLLNGTNEELKKLSEGMRK